MLTKIIARASLAFVLACIPTEASAGLFGRCRARRAARYAACQTTQTTYTQTTQATFTQTTVSSGGPHSTAGFLPTLNAWRARHGRGPVGWDQGLAAYAATNNLAGHAPCSVAPGSSQCWAGVGDETQALYMWFNSPSHASILLNATTSVGVSRCPSGTTCNAR